MQIQKKAPGAVKTPFAERDGNNNSPKQTPETGLQRSSSNSSLKRSKSICSPVDEAEEPPESPGSPSVKVSPKKSPKKQSPKPSPKKSSPKAAPSSPRNLSPAVLPVGTPGKRRAQNPVVARKASSAHMPAMLSIGMGQ